MIESCKVGAFLLNKYEITIGRRNSKIKPNLNLVPYTLYPRFISNLHCIIKFNIFDGQYRLIVKSKNNVKVNNVNHFYNEEIILNNKCVINIKDIKMIFMIKEI